MDGFAQDFLRDQNCNNDCNIYCNFILCALQFGTICIWTGENIAFPALPNYMCGLCTKTASLIVHGRHVHGGLT